MQLYPHALFSPFYNIMPRSIAAFISPHGFGHAARSIAVGQALQQREPDLQLHIFTTVPEHLFTESLTNIHYHEVITDVGMVQSDALNCDVARTKDALVDFLGFKDELIKGLAGMVRDCHSVLCDISPVGIEVARRTGRPSVLVENFTWDWIYKQHPELDLYAKQLSKIYSLADLRIQAEPVCSRVDTLSCPPIFRKKRHTAGLIREQLGADNRKIILISMGGIAYPLERMQGFEKHEDCFFVIAGQNRTSVLGSNSLGLSVNSDFYHPDLVCASDLVLCKSGYSSVAECYQAGSRVIAIDREGFAESPVLTGFIREKLGGTIIYEKDFVSGKWLDILPEMLQKPNSAPAAINGADTVAETILSR